jgi:ABC-type branched-subunit amino acid transport system substrate-binding protein
MRILAALLLLAFLPALTLSECAKLKVGVITGLSGPAQVWGQSIQNGLDMGREESGCETLRFLYEDDQFVPNKTVAAFKKLVESDRVDAIIVTSSTAGNTVAPLAEIPLFAWASDPNVARGRKFVVRTWASSEKEGRILAKRAKLNGHQRVAFTFKRED